MTKLPGHDMLPFSRKLERPPFFRVQHAEDQSK
jgi:hypothetical protein